MKNVFAKLISRAWDAAPRARPQISPRFAPRPTSSTVEEIDAEVEAPRAGERVVRDVRRQMEQTEQAEQAELQTDGAPDRRRTAVSARPVTAEATSSPLRVSPSATFAREDGDGLARSVLPRDGIPEPRAASVPERSAERAAFERVRVVQVETPVAAPPPPLRPSDAAVLRSTSARPSPESAARSAGVPRAQDARAVSTPSAANAPQPEPIQISIGRIDVRAIPAAPPPPAPRRPPAHTALPLNEYLRRRQEGR